MFRQRTRSICLVVTLQLLSLASYGTTSHSMEHLDESRNYFIQLINDMRGPSYQISPDLVAESVANAHAKDSCSLREPSHVAGGWDVYDRMDAAGITAQWKVALFGLTRGFEPDDWESRVEQMIDHFKGRADTSAPLGNPQYSRIGLGISLCVDQSHRFVLIFLSPPL